VKTRHLANVCAPDLATLCRPLRGGFARIRHQPTVALAFLQHAGLGFWTVADNVFGEIHYGE